MIMQMTDERIRYLVNSCSLPCSTPEIWSVIQCSPSPLPHPLFSGCVLWWDSANPSCTPNFKWLSSAVAKIMKGDRQMFDSCVHIDPSTAQLNSSATSSSTSTDFSSSSSSVFNMHNKKATYLLNLLFSGFDPTTPSMQLADGSTSKFVHNILVYLSAKIGAFIKQMHNRSISKLPRYITHAGLSLLVAIWRNLVCANYSLYS